MSFSCVEFMTHAEQTHNILFAIREAMFAMNESMEKLNTSTLTNIQTVASGLAEVELKVGAMENEPRRTLDKEVDGIHKEVRRCGHDLGVWS